MSYDLKPVNKKEKTFSIGAFSWPIMLQQTGMGYVLGYGAGRAPASYVYQSNNKGSPVSNDGYKVSGTDAKIMAKILRGYISVQRFVNKEWEAVPEEEKKMQKDAKIIGSGTPLYRGEVHEDVLVRYEKFAEFAEKSKGFSIH